MPLDDLTALAPLTCAVTVPLEQRAAFDLFTAGLASWWPPRFSWSGNQLVDIGIEPREGGFLYEVGPHGMRLDWGRVLRWQPPSGLVFTWQIGADRVPEPDPEHASQVEVRLAPSGDCATRITVEHRLWHRHRKHAGWYRSDFEPVWPYLLGEFAGRAERDTRA